MERSLRYVVLAAACVVLVLSAFQMQHWDSDIYWALRSGQWIVDNLRVPHTDPFSYTFAGEPWVDFTWGFQVSTHLFYEYLGGWAGLFVFQLVLTGVTFAALYANLRRISGARAWLYPALFMLVLAAAGPRLFIRPHLPGYLFISVYLLLLTLHERTGRGRLLLALPPLQLLWVNLHSSAVLGIFIVGAWAGGQVVDEWRRGGWSMRLDLSGTSKRLLALAVAVPLVSVINPYGVKLVIFPFFHQAADNSDALRHIHEWVRLPINELFFYFWPRPLSMFAFWVLAVVTLAALFLNRRNLGTRDLIITAGAFYMALSHRRWVPLFGFLAAPVAAANLAGWLEARMSSEQARDTALRPALLALTAFVVGVLAADYSSFESRRHYGLGPEPGAYPETTVEFMRERGLTGNIFNEYVFGGYLIYHYPEARPFIDGRTPTVYSPYFFWKSRLVNNPGLWEKLAGEYDIDMALIKPEVTHCANLASDPGWAAVAFDDKSVLFLERNKKFAPVIDEWGLERTNPCTSDKPFEIPKDPGAREEMRAELEWMAGLAGTRAARPHRLLALLYDELGGEYDERAATELRTALAVKDEPKMWYELGLVLSELGRDDEALRAFETAMTRKEGYTDPYLAAGLALFDAGDYDGASGYLGKYVRFADDGAEPIGIRTLGMSCFESGRMGCAEAYLRRAAFRTDDDREYAEVSYYLGNTLAEMGRLDEAADWYSKAMRADPAYAGVLRELAGKLEKVEPERAGIIRGLLNGLGY